MQEDRRLIVRSETLGVMPCQVVARNGSRYLVLVSKGGHTVGPIDLAREEVYELQEGWTLRDGRIVPVEGGEEGRAEEPAILAFDPERVPAV